jgi:hypothetical protein
VLNHEAGATLFFGAQWLSGKAARVIVRPGEPLWKTLPA